MRAIGHARKEDVREPVLGTVRLAHDERALRRRLVPLEAGGEVLADLPQTVALENGDVLLLEGGGAVAVIAADEALYEVRAADPGHLLALCWHLGNRHFPVEIGFSEGTPAFLLISREPVVGAMLTGLGARLSEVRRPFAPLRGAYHGHAHG